MQTSGMKKVPMQEPPNCQIRIVSCLVTQLAPVVRSDQLAGGLKTIEYFKPSVLKWLVVTYDRFPLQIFD